MIELADTPRLGILYCPACEPERDPTREILETFWCAQHTPDQTGADDSVTGTGRGLSGTAEAEGAVCAAMARLIR